MSDRVKHVFEPAPYTSRFVNIDHHVPLEDPFGFERAVKEFLLRSSKPE